MAASRAADPKAQSHTDEACPACGHQMKPSRAVQHLPVNAESMAVRGLSHMRCPHCGETLLSLDEARQLREGAFEIYRKKYALLTPVEIRALRERLQLTQAGMAALLRLGDNTLSRWESGRNVQTGAMDVLLRMLRDVPATVDYLKKHAA